MEIRSLCISPKHIGNKITAVVKSTKEKLKIRKIPRVDKKKIMIASSVLLIGAAVYLNYVFFLSDADANKTNTSNPDNSQIVNNDSAEDYFAKAALERQKSRDEALQVLQVVVNNEDALAESKESALRQMSQIADEMQKESNIESLIVSKGFEECVAVISEGKCNVVVKCDELQANQISQIKEIIYEQANITPINVKIIEKN
jgi:stage III sporulation protein AH